MDVAIFEDDERVDLEVSEVEICIYVVQPNDEVYESIFALSGKGWADERLYICTGREAFCIDGNF